MGRGKHLTGNMEGHRGILTHEEALQLLSEMATKGSVTAAVALERALRHHGPRDDLDRELDRLLSRDD